jgi:hypothetical protein
MYKLLYFDKMLNTLLKVFLLCYEYNTGTFILYLCAIFNFGLSVFKNYFWGIYFVLLYLIGTIFCNKTFIDRHRFAIIYFIKKCILSGASVDVVDDHDLFYFDQNREYDLITFLIKRGIDKNKISFSQSSNIVVDDRVDILKLMCDNSDYLPNVTLYKLTKLPKNMFEYVFSATYQGIDDKKMMLIIAEFNKKGETVKLQFIKHKLSKTADNLFTDSKNELNKIELLNK